MRKTLIQTLLTAFCAILATAPLEGGGVMLIGMRNAMLSGGKRTPTAKDYVQDSLVAMWDGIENAGWGVHDPNATTWKDLVGSFDFNVNVSFSGSALLCPGDVSPTQKNASTAVAQTIELVFKRNKSVNAFLIYSKGNAVYTKGFLSAIYSNRIFFDNATTKDAPVGMGRTSVSATSKSGTNNFVTSEIYVNGTECSSSTSDQWSDGAESTIIGTRQNGTYKFNGEINCIRLYNRVLNQSEILFNYAVDKARFDLPGAT